MIAIPLPPVPPEVPFEPCETKTKRFFLCPHCHGGMFEIEHLFEVNPMGGPTWCWGCKKCGLDVEFKLEQGQVLARPRHDRPRHVEKLVLLKMDEIHLVVHHSTSEDTTEEQERYYFDQHTCPTNYFRDTVAILLPPHDADPHGLFQYIASAPRTIKDEPNESCQGWLAHFGQPHETD